MSSTFVRVLAVADVPPGGKKPVIIDGKCLLICQQQDRYYAISNVCSHNDKPLERGRMGNGWIACPTHGARFELATGKALNLPATKAIDSYELRVIDGWIEVQLP